MLSIEEMNMSLQDYKQEPRYPRPDRSSLDWLAGNLEDQE